MEPKIEKSCENCTGCCEGWLTADIYGKEMFPGQPCFYKGDKCCTIYDERPDDPCKQFECEWRKNEDYPAWMKPSISKSLHIRRRYMDSKGAFRPYLDVWEMGEPVTNDVLFFCMLQYVKTGIPMRIQVNGNTHNFGPPDFLPR